MKQINNGFCECYYLTEEGTVYNKKTNKYLKFDDKHGIKLKGIDGKPKKIQLKRLYKLVYNKDFCIDNIEDLEGEEWKEINETEGKYLVSNMGRVKSLAGYEARILKPNYINKYQKVDIMIKGRSYAKLVSRLVAAAFLMPPKSINEQIHHLNGIADDNRAINICWVTPAEHREIHNQLRKLKKEKEKNEQNRESTESTSFNNN